MEAGPVSAKSKGDSRLVFSTVVGFDFEGGHLEDHGVSPTGEVVEVPLHRHQVEVDFTRVEFEYDYTFRQNWDIWMRLPFEVKRRDAGIEFLEPVSPEERQAILRNKEIHHDSDTLTGLSDLRLLFARRRLNVLRQGDGLDIGFGTSLPTGRTEGDPFKAGDAGLEHEHIQFGTGTFDPLLEVFYTAPLAPSMTLGTFFGGRIPFYENSKTYQGPLELTSAVHLFKRYKSPWTLRSALTGYYQGYAHWDGTRDINSGLWSLNLSVGAGYGTNSGLQMSVAVRHPLAQETLDAAGDTFEQGPSFLFFISRSLKAAPATSHSQ